MINWNEFQASVWTTFDELLACNGVIWANQGEHRPERPYASLMASSLMRVGHDDKIYDHTTQSFALTGMRDVTISVNYFGADGMQKMSKLQMANEFEWVRNELLEEGIVFVSAGEIRDLSELEGVKFSSRFQMDVQLRVNSLVTEENVGYIEATELNNAFDDSTSLVGTPFEEEP